TRLLRRQVLIEGSARILAMEAGAQKLPVWQRMWADRLIYVFLLPTILLMGAFTLYPMLASIWFSLLDRNGFQRAGSFIGLGNYAELVADPLFWNAFKNTF